MSGGKIATFYIVKKDGSIEVIDIDSNIENGYSLDSPDELDYYVLPVSCNKCHAVTLLVNPFPLPAEVDSREMGPEYMWDIEEETECKSCKQHMEIQIDTWHYALSGGAQTLRAEGCTTVRMYGIEGLKGVLHH